MPLVVQVALHYRTAPQLAGQVEAWGRARAEQLGLRVQSGRMVLELKPPVDRDKGMVIREAVDQVGCAWYFGDEELQALIDAVATTTDPEERAQVVADMQARLWDQMWHVPLYNSDFTIAHSDRLSDLDVRPNFRTDFYPASVSE